MRDALIYGHSGKFSGVILMVCPFCRVIVIVFPSAHDLSKRWFLAVLTVPVKVPTRGAGLTPNQSMVHSSHNIHATVAPVHRPCQEDC